jgi:hypothetical protein
MKPKQKVFRIYLEEETTYWKDIVADSPEEAEVWYERFDGDLNDWEVDSGGLSYLGTGDVTENYEEDFPLPEDSAVGLLEDLQEEINRQLEAGKQCFLGDLAAEG